MGVLLGPPLAAMSWARWAACIGGAIFGLVMVIGQTTAAQKHSFPIKRYVDVAVALIAGVLCGAILSVMAVAFVGAGRAHRLVLTGTVVSGPQAAGHF